MVNHMNRKVSELELKVLYDIGHIIEQALNLNQAVELILEILSDHLSMKRATITLRDPEKDFLSIRASHGLRTEEKEKGVYGLDEGVTGLIFRTAEPFVVPDISREPLFLNKTGARNISKGKISFIGVPIILHGTQLGVLSVDRLFDEDVSFEEDVRFLTIIAVLVAQLVSLNNQVLAREQSLIKANLSLKAELSQKSRSFLSAGASKPMSNVKDLLCKVAPTKATVLLLGESGTGKTLVARIIHELSSRVRFPFVKVNCAALPDNLLESELFGHEKGAFTGAAELKTGRVEEADAGTLFLDEIGELPLPLQAKLLRFLQDREFERLGSSKTRKIDVRVIAATNRELTGAVAEGSFREDLYYRLNVFPIRVPPLRERSEDIVSLVRFFCNKIAGEYGYAPQFTSAALKEMLLYSWPGNVREMENLVERLAIIFMGDSIDVKDLAPYLARTRERDHQVDLEGRQLGSLRERERTDLMSALERHKGIQSHAAKDLGLTLRQLGYKVKRFGLEDFVKQKRLCSQKH
jgi:Nif-specific regulatory protein